MWVCSQYKQYNFSCYCVCTSGLTRCIHTNVNFIISIPYKMKYWQGVNLEIGDFIEKLPIFNPHGCMSCFTKFHLNHQY